MTAREEIALQLTLKTIEKISFNDYESVKTHPYEIYNSIYKNIETHSHSGKAIDVLKRIYYCPRNNAF